MPNTIPFQRKIISCLDGVDLSDESKKSWLTVPDRVVRSSLENFFHTGPIEQKRVVFPVNYYVLLSGQIKELGADYVSRDLNDMNFPRSGEDIEFIEGNIVSFGHTVHFSEAEEYIRQNGMRGASVHELFAFALLSKMLPWPYNLVALGSRLAFLEGSHVVPYIAPRNKELWAGLRWLEDVWPAKWSFLGICL